MWVTPLKPLPVNKNLVLLMEDGARGTDGRRVAPPVDLVEEFTARDIAIIPNPLTTACSASAAIPTLNSASSGIALLTEHGALGVSGCLTR